MLSVDTSNGSFALSLREPSREWGLSAMSLTINVKGPPKWPLVTNYDLYAVAVRYSTAEARATFQVMNCSTLMKSRLF